MKYQFGKAPAATNDQPTDAEIQEEVRELEEILGGGDGDVDAGATDGPADDGVNF